MTRKWWIDEGDQLRVGRLIAAVFLVVLAVGYFFACGIAQSLDEQSDHGWWQLWAYEFTQDGAWFDVARTTATLVAIPGAAVALVIAFARHRVSQQQVAVSHKQVAVSQQQVAQAAEEARKVHERELARRRVTERQLELASAESRALEERELDRRINEQYVQAVDQLRDDSAVARVAGMHALDRLAQRRTDLRSIVVDVWCAYLRMKRRLESDGGDADEREVRTTCTRLLLAHLNPKDKLLYWDASGVRIDLTDADLSSYWDASECRFPAETSFANTTFGANPRFSGAEFGEGTTFEGALMPQGATFDSAVVNSFASFRGVTLHGLAVFDRVQFGDGISFSDASISDVSFDGAEFGALAWFHQTEFGNETSFEGTRFGDHADFEDARFGKNASFEGASFGDSTTFSGTYFAAGAEFHTTRFGENSKFEGATFGIHRARGDGTWWLHGQPESETADYVSNVSEMGQSSSRF